MGKDAERPRGKKAREKVRRSVRQKRAKELPESSQDRIGQHESHSTQKGKSGRSRKRGQPKG